ncbi:ADP-ribosylation factor-related protein 1 [Hordeum vulgare]|nr:ADP-ribosylation factor-related protein 1 [Hordeum vulgare]
MGLSNYGRKGTHDREAGSSSGRRRGSGKEEVASPLRQAAAPFTIALRPIAHRNRQYLIVEVCRRYWETRTPVPWSDVHLPNAWHLSADRVPIPPVPTSGRALARRSIAVAASSPTTSTTTQGTPPTTLSGTHGSGMSTTCVVPRTSSGRSRGRGGHGRCGGVHGCAASRPCHRLHRLRHHLHLRA